MRRPLTLLAATAALLLVEPSAASAADGPDIPFFISWWKTLLVVIFIPLWAFAADRIAFDIDRVAADVGVPAVVWNPILVFTFPVLLAVAILMPMFAITIAIVVVAFIAPVATYVGIRNSKVVPEQRVMTPTHLKLWFSNIGRRGPAQVVEAKMSWEAGPQVLFDIDKDGQPRLIQARQSEFFVTMKEWVADILDRNADRAMFDYTAEAVAIRYEIDGVWHPLEARDRESGDQVVAVLKHMLGLNAADRRGRQEQKFKLKYNGQKLKGTLATQGTATGERVLITIDRGITIRTLEELGLRPQLREVYNKHLRASKGLVLVSAMPGGGLKTNWTVTLQASDRFTRDFVSVQDESLDYLEVENVLVHKSNKANGQTPDTKLPEILLRQPEVLCIPEIPNAESVNALCEQVNQHDMLTFASIRAKDALEALLRVLLLKADPSAFARAVTCVSNTRLIRKLCDGCKQGFEPQPQYLQQLGIPPGRIQVLYQEWQPTEEQPERPECNVCGGIGYHGRTALMELLEVNDTIRDILVKQPKLELLRQAARQAGFRSAQEEGILMVAQGVTSVPELKRALSQ